MPLTAAEVFADRDKLINKRNLIAWNFYNPAKQDEQIDLMIDYDLGERIPDSRYAGDIIIPILNLENLIAMKRKSGRPQDLVDIEALEKLSS